MRNTISNLKRQCFIRCLVVYPLLFVLLGLIQTCIPLEAQTLDYATERLQLIHSKLRLIHGSLLEEFPEQLMTAMFLPEDAKVLELGGNVGRNSCVIASILNDSSNLVTMESCPKSAKLLKKNRDFNGLRFHIEVAAISKIPLIQSEWNSMPSTVDVPGFFRVNTMTFDEVQKKYGMEFNTLVADCEGALYNILLDDPEMLRNMKLIIIENDFRDFQNMLFVHDLFKRYGLELVYNREGGWEPCYHYFYQVWSRP
jgi:FkbM family methyltransferase